MADEEWKLRLAFAAASVKDCWLAPLLLKMLAERPTSTMGSGGEDERQPEEALVLRAPIFAMLLRWAEEARAIAATRNVRV